MKSAFKDMGCIFMRFPGGRAKALTLSYDDGAIDDIRLVEIMKKNGLKGTFNLNSGKYAPEGTEYIEGGTRKMTRSRSIALLKDSGMEVAVHCLNHPVLNVLPPNLCTYEVLQDRLNHEEDYGMFVRGMAYPFGSCSDSVITTLKQCGIVYSRITRTTHKFDLPDDWFRLQATCHHKDPELMVLVRKFLEEEVKWTSRLFYMWGHSYEFNKDNNWDLMEKFAETAGGRADIWYATNIEIYDYIAAFNNLIFSTKGTMVYNPTNTILYFETAEGIFCVNPGETLQFR